MSTILTQEALSLLQDLIAIQSFSSEEAGTARRIEQWFTEHAIPFSRENNNIFAFNKNFQEGKPTLLLNSHHDTVKPNSAYTKDPFHPRDIFIQGEVLHYQGGSPSNFSFAKNN